MTRGGRSHTQVWMCQQAQSALITSALCEHDCAARRAGGARSSLFSASWKCSNLQSGPQISKILVGARKLGHNDMGNKWLRARPAHWITRLGSTDTTPMVVLYAGTRRRIGSHALDRRTQASFRPEVGHVPWRIGSHALDRRTPAFGYHIPPPRLRRIGSHALDRRTLNDP
jgi:hypothetical protein